MLYFLDIDGVMVPAKGWKNPEFLFDGFPAFSSHATLALQNLISEEDTVILTSSHKSNFSIEEWKDIFKNRGLVIKNLLSLPENLNNLSRKDEIVSWFNNNFIEDNFVIIDDDKSLNELPDSLKKNLVLTSPLIGLTLDHLAFISSLSKKGIQSE